MKTAIAVSRSCRVVTPDLRGSGRSWSSDTLTFEMLARDIEALLDYLDVDQAVLGGESSGSGTALSFALGHPSRIAALVIVRPIYAGDAYSLMREDSHRRLLNEARRARCSPCLRDELGELLGNQSWRFRVASAAA